MKYNMFVHRHILYDVLHKCAHIHERLNLTWLQAPRRREAWPGGGHHSQGHCHPCPFCHQLFGPSGTDAAFLPSIVHVFAGRPRVLQAAFCGSSRATNGCGNFLDCGMPILS